MLTEWKLWRRSYLRFIHTCEVNTIFRKNGSESGNTLRISPGGTTSRLVLFAATLPEEFVLKNFQYKVPQAKCNKYYESSVKWKSVFLL